MGHFQESVAMEEPSRPGLEQDGVEQDLALRLIARLPIDESEECL
jgi:hypothetical protein